MTRWVWPVVAVLLLGACAHLPVGTDGLSYDARRASLEALDQWEIRGRLAVDTGERGFQGSFNWRQQADMLELGVRGPFGNNVLTVSGTPVTLTVTARGETRVLEDPEQQLSALLGWWLPVGSLHAWLVGLPDKGFRATIQNGEDGTLAAFDQRLWHVAYTSYQLASLGPLEGSLLVPRRIDLAHGDLKLRLTIDDWQTAARAPAP